MTKGPVLIDLDDEDIPLVAEAPPVPEFVETPPDGRAMQSAARLAARPASRLARWFWGLLGLIFGAVVSVAAWDFVTGLVIRIPVLGWVVTGLIAAFVLVAFALAVRELAGFARLRRVDSLRAEAEQAIASGTQRDAQSVLAGLNRLYRSREDTAWGRARVQERQGDLVDGGDLLALAEREILEPLDKAATLEIEAASRQVALVTALVPLALADVVTALAANMRMIRRIAEIYGGRSGTLGSWRLMRVVMTHLVATGAVAAGDDLIGTLAGGGALAKVSRRFGEGLVNGALTARVGVAAMEVCRPMPFEVVRRPSVSGLVKRSLTGLFSS